MYMIRVSDKMYIPLSEISENVIQRIKDDLTVPNKDYENALRYSKYGRVNLPKNIYFAYIFKINNFFTYFQNHSYYILYHHHKHF